MKKQEPKTRVMLTPSKVIYLVSMSATAKDYQIRRRHSLLFSVVAQPTHHGSLDRDSDPHDLPERGSVSKPISSFGLLTPSLRGYSPAAESLLLRWCLSKRPASREVNLPCHCNPGWASFGFLSLSTDLVAVGSSCSGFGCPAGDVGWLAGLGSSS